MARWSNHAGRSRTRIRDGLIMIARRDFLPASGATLALAALGIAPSAWAAKRLRFGSAQPYSHDALINEARHIAGKPYASPAAPPHDLLDKIDYEAHGKIKFPPESAVFA